MMVVNDWAGIRADLSKPERDSKRQALVDFALAACGDYKRQYSLCLHNLRVACLFAVNRNRFPLDFSDGQFLAVITPTVVSMERCNDLFKHSLGDGGAQYVCDRDHLLDVAGLGGERRQNPDEYDEAINGFVAAVRSVSPAEYGALRTIIFAKKFSPASVFRYEEDGFFERLFR